jgi:hypothetical protein
MKLVPENPGNKEVVVETPTTKKRYKANRGGIYEVENKNHAKQMLDNGCVFHPETILRHYLNMKNINVIRVQLEYNLVR